MKRKGLGERSVEFSHLANWHILEIPRISALEPGHVQVRWTAGGLRKNFDGGLGLVITAKLATHNKDTAVGKKDCRRVPALALKVNLLKVFFPVVSTVDTGTAVRGEQATSKLV
jgi:hypothetical protein